MRIAIIEENTLAAIGLAGIIRQMMPAIDVCLFTEMAELMQAEEEEPFHHFFVSTRALTAHAAFFIAHSRHTIVLTHGAEVSSVPCDFPTLNVCQSEGQLTRAILRLAENGVAVCILSSEAQEIIRLCDRALVMFHGEIRGELRGDDLNEHSIMVLATGGRLENADAIEGGALE